jgi:hypothetical protein
VVSAALVFWNPETVRKGWEGSAAAQPREEAARLFANCLTAWGEAHVGDDVDWGRLADLAGRIVEHASPSAAPIFAGWRTLPVPESDRAAALHHLNGLRELRMARHGAAVVAHGLAMPDVVRHRTPVMADIFGWGQGDVPEDVPARWDEAEALTDGATNVDYSLLDDGEAEELVALCAAASGSVR